MIQQHPLPQRTVRCQHGKHLDLAQPQVMGILNVTPDSFSDGGKYNEIDAALNQCEQMIENGASIIDIGGESTRPNASPVSEQEELDRVVPIVEAIRKRFDVIMSIDTSTPAVMQAAYNVGGDIWNDVRALSRDGAKELAAQLNIPVMLMHTRGEPSTMMQMTDYEDVVTDVKHELQQKAEHAVQFGVKPESIILDVGFGFAKTTEQNLQLLKQLTEFHQLGYPLMIGLSRKRMLADTLAQAGLDNSLDNRTTMGVTAATIAIQQGVSIIRTHNVLETMQAIALLRALDNTSDN